jgi:hypothetical protein
VKCSLVRRDDHLANRPKRDAGKLEVRPGKWKSDDRHGKKNRHDDMAERQPPPRQHQPYDVSQNAERPGADVLDLCDCRDSDFRLLRPLKAAAEGKKLSARPTVSCGNVRGTPESLTQGVIPSAIDDARDRCLLYLNHPTLVARVGTSRSCQLRTHAPQ